MLTDACVTINHRLIGRCFFYCRASGGPVTVVDGVSLPSRIPRVRADAKTLEQVARLWVAEAARELRALLAEEEAR